MSAFEWTVVEAGRITDDSIEHSIIRLGLSVPDNLYIPCLSLASSEPVYQPSFYKQVNI